MPELRMPVENAVVVSQFGYRLENPTTVSRHDGVDIQAHENGVRVD